MLCRSILFIFLITSLTGLAVPAAPQPVTLQSLTDKLKAGQPLVFATFGDSITWPCFHTDFRQNYITFAVDALRKEYPRAQIKIVHAGNMGSAGRGLAQGRFERYVLADKPDLVVIMYGMNDCLGGEAALADYDRNLTRLIEMTRARGALPVIATQNEILYDSADGRPRRALPLYTARALEVAAREGAVAADCFALWKPLTADSAALTARLNDWIHPNHAGHRLMAKGILQALWPEAVAHMDVSARTPFSSAAGEPVACLLPGPAGKQVLRTRDGTWLTISGRLRDRTLRDLVFSFSRKEQPAWSDFEHITLIGYGKEAVFDAMDRTLTAGLLLEHDSRVHVVFSWNIGVYTVSLDLGKPNWAANVRDPQTWLEQTADPFVRPTGLANSQTGSGLLHDAYMHADGRPAIFATARKMAPGAGWEVIEGQDGIALFTRPAGKAEPVSEFMFPEFQTVRCTQTADGKTHWAAQKREYPLLFGHLDSKESTASAPGTEILLAEVTAGTRPAAVISQGNNQAEQKDAVQLEKWEVVSWGGNEGRVTALQPPDRANDRTTRMVPLPWSDGQRSGVHWSQVPAGEPNRPAFAYQSRLSPGSETLGVLTDAGGRLTFATARVKE